MDINILWKAMLIAAALVVGFGSSHLFKMKEDNTIEEVAEHIICEQKEIDLDMTPTTKEA